jgi:hypothetical protein
MDAYTRHVARLSMSAEDYRIFTGMSGDDQHDVIMNARQRGADNMAWRIAMDWVLGRPPSPRQARGHAQALKALQEHGCPPGGARRALDEAFEQGRSRLPGGLQVTYSAEHGFRLGKEAPAAPAGGAPGMAGATAVTRKAGARQ